MILKIQNAFTCSLSWLIIFCSYFLIPFPSVAVIKLPRLITDGMVLQRGTKVKIWGWSSPAEKVNLKFKEKIYSANGDKAGKWAVYLDNLEAGGPYSMEVKGENLIIIKNILIGEVWVCSGQSNMELPMARVSEKYPEIVANTKNSLIRQFDVATRYNFIQPDTDLSSGQWKEANAENISGFSAVGYFFAKALFEKYHVPIGIIRAAVGGSPAEAWLSEQALHQFPQELEIANKWKDTTYLLQEIEKANRSNNTWHQRLWENDKGMHAPIHWYEPEYDDSNWDTLHVPGYWEDQGLKDVDGVVWYRKKVRIPASMVHLPAKLFLGCIADCDSVYINGKFVGTTGYQYPPRRYNIGDGVLREGENIFVVRIINTEKKGGFYKDKPYKIEAGGQSIDLTGTWKYALGFKCDARPTTPVVRYQPLGLFNAMIAPLLNFAIKGVIWYQGESNTSNPKAYQKIFPALIQDWRKHWKLGDFPFLYVQLANFNEAVKEPGESNWAELREAQLKTLAVPNTCMAVTIDIGEWNDIHPLNKQDVGNRLARCAFNVAYGDQKVIASGPTYSSFKITGEKIIIDFNTYGSSLVVKGSNGLQGFAVAGSDKIFRLASAHLEGNKVILYNKQITKPLYFRYAWADNPEGANLYNKEGLPVGPFRNDE